MEKRVRAGLRKQFDATLSRLNLMAQLDRHPCGPKMKELSHQLMVIGGNVTGITDQLVAEGLVGRHALVSTMRACPQRIMAALDGACASAGAMMALASDLRLGTPAVTVAFLFIRVGLADADMCAYALLPGTIGQSRASVLLFTGRAMTSAEGLAWGFFNALHESDTLLPAAQKRAAQPAQGPTFAHGMTDTMLHQEWAMTLGQAIEAEAKAQAICMQRPDFGRACEAFALLSANGVRCHTGSPLCLTI